MSGAYQSTSAAAVTAIVLSGVLSACSAAGTEESPMSTEQSVSRPLSGQRVAAQSTLKRSSGASTPSSNASLSPSVDGGPLVYQFGPVISKVKVVPVFWGNNVDGTVKANIPGFLSRVTQSHFYMDWLAEYSTTMPGGTNQVIGTGSATAAITISPANPTANHITAEEIQTELAAQIDSHVLPQADENTFYMVYFPPLQPGDHITNVGGHSCGGADAFCGVHRNFLHGSASIRYAIIPDFGPGSGCDVGCGSNTQFNNVTAVSSHELIEAVTDPNTVGGWRTASNTYEIADTCEADQDTLPGSSDVVQLIWSNRFGVCTSGYGPGNVVGLGGKCIEVPGYNTTNGTSLDYFDCNGGGNQVWRANSTPQLTGLGGKCIDLPGYNTANGAILDLYDCNGGGNQAWNFTYAEIRGYGNKCFEIPGGNTTNGTGIDYYDCHNATNQKWTFTTAGEIRGQDNKCLDVPAANTANGTQVVYSDCNGGQNQKWAVQPGGAITGLGNKCLDLPASNTANGTGIVIYDCNGGQNQKWVISGSVVGFGGKCLDLPASNAANGTPLAFYDCLAAGNQNWTFFP